MSGKIKVFGNISPTVDWADPVEEPDDEVMATVSTSYYKSLCYYKTKLLNKPQLQLALCPFVEIYFRKAYLK